MRGFIRQLVAPVIGGLALLGLGVFVLKPLLEHPNGSVPGVVLHDLQATTELRDRFNADQGAPRLIVLLSPT